MFICTMMSPIILAEMKSRDCSTLTTLEDLNGFENSCSDKAKTLGGQ